LVWLKFTLCVITILFAGRRLARYGDAIAEKTGLGRIWIGLVLIALITSIPELVTSLSAVTLLKLPDLSVGNLFGSCLFNLTLLVILDLMLPRPVLSQVSPRHHMLSASFGILLGIVAAGGILAGGGFPGLTLGWVNVPSIMLFVLYIAAVWWFFRSERSYQSPPIEAVSPRYKELPTRTVYLRFGLAAAVIIGAGIWLSFIGDEIAATYTWQATFVGSLFVAITTSLPELSVTIAAAHMGALDMGVANILGSNMFDIVIITPVDLAFRQGPILSFVSRAHLLTVAIYIIMNLVVMVGLRFPLKRKTLRFVSWYSIVLVGLYVFGMYRLFTFGTGLG